MNPMTKHVACENVRGAKHDRCWKRNDLISCHLYMDRKNMIQKKCSCGHKNKPTGFPKFITMPNFVVNGCGPRGMGPDSAANKFLLPQTVSCCNAHDLCMNDKIVDSGVCAEEFTQCLKHVPDFSTMGVFRRNLLDHMVKTSSYKFVKDAADYNCSFT